MTYMFISLRCSYKLDYIIVLADDFYIINLFQAVEPLGIVEHVGQFRLAPS